MRKVFIISVILAGILLALQIRSFQRTEFLLQRSEGKNFLAELRLLQIANEALRTQISSEAKALADLQSKISAERLEEELKNLRILSGQEAVSGEGIEITLSAPIESFWLTDGIAQLVSAGAEVFAINDIRLTNATAGLRDVAQGMLMGRTFLRPPYKISVIGPRQDLIDAVGHPGGLISRIEKSHPGLKVVVAQRERLIILGKR